MKTLRTLKIAFVMLVMFSATACELVEEPNMDEVATTTGESAKADDEVD